jgi:hypothetical protein
MLCKLCQNIFEAWEDCTIRVFETAPFVNAWRKRGKHHTTVESLKASASLDCYICHIPLKEWKRNDGRQPNPKFLSHHVDHSLSRDAKKYGGFLNFLQYSSGSLAIFGLEGLSEFGKP